MKRDAANEDMEYAYAWYKPEQWQLLRAVSTDKDRLEETHAEWESQAKESFLQYRRDGMDITKVVIDVTELIDWCKKKDRPVDGAARATFVALKLKETQVVEPPLSPRGDKAKSVR